MEYLRTDTVSVGTLYRKDAKLSRGAGAYFCKHFVPPGAQGGGRLPTLPLRCSQGGACLLCRQPTLPLWCSQGSLPSLPPAYPAFPDAAGGLGGFGRLPTLPLACFTAPIPPPPFPAGRGRLKVYFAGGFAPGTPALDRLRHLQFLPYRFPAGACLACRLLPPAFTFFSAPLSPRPPSPGWKGEL